jgi:predicted DCC family thiol-disulfide oxidoreductase YuxK
MSSARPILLFDGVCNVCNASVRFVLEHERAPLCRFAALQSEAGARLVREHGVSGDIGTMVFIYNGRAFTRSGAVVRTLKTIGGPWRWLGGLLWLVPAPLRDLAYLLFARMRYRLFGKRDSCMIPTPEIRARFLP